MAKEVVKTEKDDIKTPFKEFVRKLLLSLQNLLYFCVSLGQAVIACFYQLMCSFQFCGEFVEIQFSVFHLLSQHRHIYAARGDHIGRCPFTLEKCHRSPGGNGSANGDQCQYPYSYMLKYILTPFLNYQ